MSRLRDYIVVGAPVAPRPITVLEVLTHLKMDSELATDPDISAQINSMIDSAVKIGEDVTRITFRESNFKAFWDSLSGGVYAYEVRKSPLQELSTLKYKSGGTTVDYDISNVAIIYNPDFSRIQPEYGESWPSNTDNVLQSAELAFVAGFKEGELPEDLKNALLIHVASMWVNRGDCSPASAGGSCSTQCALPQSVKTTYRLNMIRDMVIGA